ncbi:probable aspartic protease At2g35615 [Impatiens glandulifera]|uniref:probable aspartic protease At2g35615 n=1 Tax=Impatiens glandulifera TaxID=253017 RepID=UPI001FB19D24|nr:probable aspartic protease At2g35615 [Impatiens glandulifera]
MERTISQSRSRLSYLKSILKLPNNHATETTDIQSTIMAAPLMYHMEIYVGTPPVKQIVGVDTASDMIWIQCHPCKNCFQQNQPIFNSHQSSSYQVLRSGSNECKKLGDKRHYIEGSDICKYGFTSLNGASSAGDLAKETYIVGHTYIENMVQGCGHFNIGNFDVQSTGIIGLGDDPLSFFGQIQDSTGGMFSYCLVSRFGSNPNARSKINFGNITTFTSHDIFYSNDVISTPLHKKEGSSHYFLTLESISVGDKEISISKQSGNIVIDNGITLSYFSSRVVEYLKYALKQQIYKRPLDVPNKLCYDLNTIIPIITYRFAGGAKLYLSKMNTFIVYDNKLCLAVEVDNDLSIFGIHSQMDFLIEYNIPKSKVSFKPTDCSMR